MPQKTLRFKIHQDGRVEETVEGFTGNSCNEACLLYTSPSPRDYAASRMPSSA